VIRVLITTASEVIRAGLTTLLGGQPDIVVETRADNVDVHLVDDDASDVDLASEPPIPAVLLTDGMDAALEALRSGARAVLPRNAAASEIVAAIRAAAAGLMVLTPAAFESLAPQSLLHASAKSSHPAAQLTARETEILRMLAEGYGNKTIAWKLSISEHTVKFHVSSIFQKLNVSSRTEATTVGARLGLIML
jgi:DNA-binding NarL/FixJ family response regulator